MHHYSMSEKYKMSNPDGIYFITFATVEWVDVFTRKSYKDVLIESLKYCQQEKGLVIYSWVIMSNHLHMIVSSNAGNLSGIIRDFKKYTSNYLTNILLKSKVESRRVWMLEIFKSAGESNSHNKNYQFWQQENHPKELLRYEHSFSEQKLDYIHKNPIVEGIVERAEDYLYSSARDYCGIKGLLEIEFFE